LDLIDDVAAASTTRSLAAIGASPGIDFPAFMVKDILTQGCRKILDRAHLRGLAVGALLVGHVARMQHVWSSGECESGCAGFLIARDKERERERERDVYY